ncbi:hypothetical protein NA57DRAFT_57592 [Rhizodiscina lignyota]|uniref:RNA polymerase II degradation factor 1 n=1 Tax=Rhizodiscina lignyota TaxID=1504668 RepID=A0A9P4I864_9PEZI|nr:hypothetical protein NA57DRAFT_57592 [Rhizodiscina lignyota]
MSEVQSRPAPRGRSSARGGRGGPRGGARGASRHVNGDHKATADIDTSADQGEIGEMKKHYLSEVAVLKEMFPDWTDVDLVFALEETNGDLPSTIERITEGTCPLPNHSCKFLFTGNVSQFAEVSKKSKDRARSKVKDSSAGATDASMSTSRPPRGRGGIEGARGGRGRGDRARGGFRGGARGATQGAANGVRPAAAKSVPTAESSAWDAIPSANKENETVDNSSTESAPGGQWGSVVASEATPNTASEGAKSALIPDGGPKKTWASMFAKPKPAPAPVPKPEVKPPPIEEPDPTVPELVEPSPPVEPEIEETTDAALLEPPAEDETPALTPSKDELTEDNVEHVPDYSNKPPSTETAVSQVGSSRDIGSATASIAHQPIARPVLGGFATTALKATTPTGRSASFQRKVMEQQEAVVMPGSSHAVDRATVQFGMMGLNGDALDVDEDREEAETRQPPQQSPPSQPRASLPPAPRQPPPAESAPEALPTPKQSQGLPPAPQQPLSQQQQQSPNPIGAQLGGQHAYNQFGRYGQQETAAPPQKPYDPFGQQASQSPLDAYNPSTQAQQAGQSQLGGQSTAPNDYSSYQTSDYQRNAYQNYYGNFGQQHGAAQQDAGTAPQRSGSGFGSAPGDSGYGSQAQPGLWYQLLVQSVSGGRYGETQGSGQTTPNPALGGAGQHQSQPGQHLPQQHHQQGQHAGGAGFPYAGHPYYNSPYYQAYMNQYNYSGQGFSGPYGGSKGGMYGQPHHGYGISPQQSSYDQHSSSPANATGFGQSSLHGGEPNLRAASGSLGDYGRSGSTQPSQGAQTGGSGFSGMADVFGRQSGFPGSNQSYGQQQGNQQSTTEDSLKPFGDSKSNAGPSPTSLGQPGRPGSATNNTTSQGQTGLPPPQSHQQGFGGYPSHLAQGSQYGGLGGLGHQGGQNHQQGGFGGYGGGYGGTYGSYGRGGWGTNYGNH